MYCQHCGTELPPDYRFCTICGKPTAFHAQVSIAGPDSGQVLQTHLRVIAILWAIYSAFRILMAVWTIAFARYFLPIVIRMIPEQSNFDIEPILRMLGGFYWFSGVFAIAMGALGLWAAWALWHRDPAGRTLVLVVACLSVLSIPIGLALAVYTLVILVPHSAGKIYTRLSSPAPQPAAE